MKRKILIVFLIVFTLFLNYMNISYGAKSTDIQKKLIDADAEWGTGSGNTETEAKIKEKLKSFGYDGSIKDEIRWETTIKFCINKKKYHNQQNNINGTYWTVKIGDAIIEEAVKFTDKNEIYACEKSAPKNDEIEKLISASNADEVEYCSYKAVIIAKKDLSNLSTSVSLTGNANAGLKYFLDSIYTGSDMEEGRNITLSEENTEIKAVTGTEEAELPNPLKLIGELLGKVFMGILNLFTLIPDAIQMGINSFKVETIEPETYYSASDKITYTATEVKANSDINNRTQFNDTTNSDVNNSEQKTISIDLKEDKISEDAEIPHIEMDAYNIASGKVPMFDVNFFSVDKTLHPEGSIWLKIRNVISVLLHIILYLSIAFLIIVLILYGIRMVKGTIIPEKKAEELNALNRFVISIFMLVGSIVIMNLAIYLSNALIESTSVNNKGDTPIRVEVLEDGKFKYAFNANLTEYIRYRTQVDSVDKIGEKILNTALYIVVVIITNGLVFLVMFARSVFIAILTIQGPIVAVAYSLNKKIFNMEYGDWIKKYLIWMLIQPIIAILMRGIMILFL